ncbi:presenilin-like protein At1g08700 [Ipomoea triloba]|uniref:presenilin-like protein At1g08700 n=1 Tax=Ipomoea triloba TaxID=35885 RepID=UPI00125CF149|nr:presenilin-like protein At1g08700 [Ipomoea triloba]
MDYGSILDTIGGEITGVMAPVSICMLLVVLIVYSLSSPTNPTATIQTAANLVYLENPSDSTAQKLEGALLNALVFVILIAVVTFVLVALYYFRFTNFIKHYVRFSVFFVLTSMGGSIFLSLIQHFNIPVDAITCALFLFNFSIVGVISVFAQGVPILLNQMYMVAVGIIVAVWFTKLPEWTTWVCLVMLALYDLVAVLAPGGPLKILVELASTRNEELPALVYESRPRVQRSRSPGVGLLLAGFSNGRSVELTAISGNTSSDGDDQNVSGLVGGNNPHSAINVPNENNEIEVSTEYEIAGETSPLMTSSNSTERQLANGEIRRNENRETRERESEEEERERGIRLGLGDFIFYSVLLGRAAMFDLMTVYACYLAIICGLGCTLILLAVCRHALPALPISIALGVMFYFLTRLLMEPFVVGASTNLIMF